MKTNISFNRAARVLLAAIGLPLIVGYATAQPYSYLPSSSITDGRFLSMAGGGIQTLGDYTMEFRLASPAYALTMEIGIFDGDTRGVFDLGSVPLIYTLYADPVGDGTGTMKLGEWSGDSLLDNDWYTISVVNSGSARGSGAGDYFYRLEVRSSDPNAFHWSNFKLRANGTIAVQRNTILSFCAPLGNALDAAVIYPNYPALDPTTYDGKWKFYMEVPAPMSALTIWDGDFDHGAYDSTDADTDDVDTPNEIPAWATSAAVAEGVAPAMPPDDSRNPLFARVASVAYDVIAPDGVRYRNGNPSGNLEWEAFQLSTAPFDRATMDHHAEVLPPGYYTIAIDGLDLSNMNAIRCPFDMVGVDAAGNPVTPIRPDYTEGTITGSIVYDGGAPPAGGMPAPGGMPVVGGMADAGAIPAGDPQITAPAATVRLLADYDNNGQPDEEWAVPVDARGSFAFNGLHPGTYTLVVDDATLPAGTIVLGDSDGTSTPNRYTGRLTLSSRSMHCAFAYHLPDGGLN